MSQTAGFTPGPWSLIEDSCAVCRKLGETEYVIEGPDGGYHGQFSKLEDARLIAAAPDLYAALQAMVGRYGYDSNSDIKRAYDALARARDGQEPA